MATSRRRKSFNLVDQIQSEPYRFDFFQAVRLLEYAAHVYPEDEPVATDAVGGISRPDQEAVHFSADPGLAFNGSDVTRVSQKRIHSHETEGGSVLQWKMDVAMMGLTGSQGVLPYSFSEILISEIRKKNPALHEFFDLFNHRIISMFYGAWHKYQMAPGYERANLEGSYEPDLFTDAFLSIAGLGLSELRFRNAVPDQSLARYAAHFGRGICSAESLRSTIEGMFGLKTDIEQFKGEWYELPEDVRCRLPDDEHPLGVNTQLGSNAVIGSVCYQVQNKFSVVIVPQSREEFMLLAPGEKTLEELKSFIKMSVGIEQDFEIEVRLSNENISIRELFNENNSTVLLGWNSHINPEILDENIISIRLSQDIPTPVDTLPMAY